MYDILFDMCINTYDFQDKGLRANVANNILQINEKKRKMITTGKLRFSYNKFEFIYYWNGGLKSLCHFFEYALIFHFHFLKINIRHTPFPSICLSATNKLNLLRRIGAERPKEMFNKFSYGYNEPSYH